MVNNDLATKAEVASLKRDQLESQLASNYGRAKSTLSSSWTDSQIRQWLIDNNLIKSDSKAKRDELLKTFQSSYNFNSKTDQYVSWSDNRIRGWLRDHNINVPMANTREELLQQMKENCTLRSYCSRLETDGRCADVTTQGGLEGLFHSVQDWISSGVHIGEDKIAQALNLLKGAVGGHPFAGYGEEAGLKVCFHTPQNNRSAHYLLSGEVRRL